MTIPFLPLIGIDVGPSAVKIAELSGRGDSRKLKALGMEILGPEVFVDGVISDVDAVETAIATLLDKLKISPTGRRAAVSLPTSVVEVKRLLVEAPRGSLESLMTYEAEQYFQTDLNNLYVRYQELDGWSEDPERVPVVLVGARRDSVDQMVDIIRSVGLRTGVIDCESLCLANIFEFNYPSAKVLTAIIDIGAVNTTVTLVFHGHILFSKSLAFGAIEYTRQIMGVMNMELDHAEALKVAAGKSSAPIPESVQNVFNDLNQAFIAEIHALLKQYFETSTPIPGVSGLSNIILSGGGSKLLGLEMLLSSAFQIPVQTLDAFARVQINPQQFELDYILNQGHVFGVAMGLALRRMGDEKES